MMPRAVVERAAAVSLAILLLPLAGILAMAVRLTLGSPILYAQDRSGLAGRQFRMFKFRTMSDARDGDGRLYPDELRTGRLGAFLRRTRLDELLGLWNIARGEMSFVGPRPLQSTTIAAMGEGGIRRGSIRPGLTGWAQVNGNTLLGEQDKLALDLWYIDHASVRLDALILWRTLLVPFRGERINPIAIRRAHASCYRRGC
jgi:lipopolysaccharide/colanic/teichoic acid biosynthesis glycosyltransferase